MNPIELIAYVGYMVELGYGVRFERILAVVFAVVGLAFAGAIARLGGDAGARAVLGGAAVMLAVVVVTLAAL